jgi:AcrR family transcriptional regulator
MSRPRRRAYVSELRREAADDTKDRVLKVAKALFARQGINRVTIAQIAEKAEVAASTVYSLYRSKDGILHAIMRSALFGQRFQAANERLKGLTDPVELVGATAQVARAIYEGESTEIGLMRGVSAFSPALRKLEQEFESIRYGMQEQRLRLLFDQSRQKQGLGFDEARRIMWMYTSRDVYRMLVLEGAWSVDRYQAWLSQALVDALVERAAHGSRV